MTKRITIIQAIQIPRAITLGLRLRMPILKAPRRGTRSPAHRCSETEFSNPAHQGRLGEWATFRVDSPIAGGDRLGQSPGDPLSPVARRDASAFKGFARAGIPAGLRLRVQIQRYAEETAHREVGAHRRHHGHASLRLSLVLSRP